MSTGNRYSKWPNAKYEDSGAQQYRRESWRNETASFSYEPRKYMKKLRPPYDPIPQPIDPNSSESAAIPEQFGTKIYPSSEFRGFERWQHVFFYFPILRTGHMPTRDITTTSNPCTL